MGWKVGKALKRLSRSRLLRVGATLAAGAVLPKALSVAKSLGARVIGNRLGSKQSKGVAVQLVKAAANDLGIPIPHLATTAGGSVIRDSSGRPREFWAGPLKRKVASSRSREAKSADKQARAEKGYKSDFARKGTAKAAKKRGKGKTSPKVRKPKAPKTKGKRTAPKGGLDLKGMAREWRAAGKPGSWRDWIKSHARKSS